MKEIERNTLNTQKETNNKVCKLMNVCVYFTHQSGGATHQAGHRAGAAERAGGWVLTGGATGSRSGRRAERGEVMVLVRNPGERRDVGAVPLSHMGGPGEGCRRPGRGRQEQGPLTSVV